MSKWQIKHNRREYTAEIKGGRFFIVEDRGHSRGRTGNNFSVSRALDSQSLMNDIKNIFGDKIFNEIQTTLQSVKAKLKL